MAYSSSPGELGLVLDVRRELSVWTRCARDEAVAAISKHCGWPLVMNVAMLLLALVAAG